MERKFTTGVRSTATFAGHPIHPVIVSFPIVFLSGALIADVGYLTTSDPFWSRAAILLLVAGLIGGLAAAVFGLIDFTTIRRARVRAGWFHVLANAAALLLSLTNLVLRTREPNAGILPWGLGLSILTVGLLFISGWFGGELAYRYKIGVIGDDNKDESIYADARRERERAAHTSR